VIRVLAIGQSNMACIVHATELMQQESRLPPGLSFTFIQMREEKYNPYFPDANNRDRLNPAVEEDVKAHLADSDLVVSYLGGNAHSVMGLLNHSRPYDFTFTAGDDLDRNREMVPRDLVRSSLRDSMADHLKMFSALRGLIDKPMIHCESPPPIPSDQHIRNHPGVFANRIETKGIAPASFRLKLWKLQSEIYREFCAANNIEFLTIPEETADAEGLLRSEAWGTDPTHGNIWYGEQSINRLARHLSTSNR
jgi:hypothetical protein